MWLLVVSLFLAIVLVVATICFLVYHLPIFALSGDPLVATLTMVVFVVGSSAIGIFHFAAPAGEGQVIPSLNLAEAPPITIYEWRTRLVRLAIIWGLVASAPLIFATWFAMQI